MIYKLPEDWYPSFSASNFYVYRNFLWQGGGGGGITGQLFTLTTNQEKKRGTQGLIKSSCWISSHSVDDVLYVG